ncbi:MAG: translation elongation factor Ts [Planctomycetaceae bacterium]|nr:translation elongation factor Ts [Planctomycetaceae bacterium]
MAEINAAMVKALREETQQSMMECKKALIEANGDVEEAKLILRKKGLASAEKKADRTINEGLVAIEVAADGKSAAMVQVQCETDFCARNEIFKAAVAQVAKMAMQAPAGAIAATDAIKDAVQAAQAKIGENMGYAQGIKVQADQVGTYLHHNSKVGVVVAITGSIDAATLSDVCMHIAFTNPMGVTKDDIPADLVEKEKAFAKEQAIESGKPADIAEKMVVGKINKFLAENALLEQPFVRDEKKKVKEVLGKATITTFARFGIGK